MSSDEGSSSDDYELFNVDPSMDRPRTAPQIKNQADEEKIYEEQEEKMVVKTVSKAIPERLKEPPTICEVPEELIEGNKGAYTPKVICIGPLFGSKRKTASMLRLEYYKLCCVHKLIVGESAAWSPEVHGELLLTCLGRMKRLMRRVHASYSSISTSNEKLAINMLLDGCFVLHHLLKYAQEGNDGNVIDNDDWNQMHGQCWVWGTVKRDLLLLSNQVPFFVLQELFKHLRNNTGELDDILVNCGLRFFSSLHPRPLHTTPIACQNVHHLLHLFYLSIDLPPSSSPSQHTSKELLLEAELTWWVPSAKELEEAGVRFRVRKQGATSFLDLRFRRGILEIPPLNLFDYSELLFRNLIAFEQTYTAMPGRITAYAIFMDCLIKTTEDVRLLHRSGVLVNHMNGNRGDTAMGEFFSGLCSEAHTSVDRNYLAGIVDDVLKYQRGKWPRWRVALAIPALVSNYFANPWVTMSVVAAVILLAVTLLQSFYAVYGYYKPSK